MDAKDSYQPSEEILDRYANVLINFALNDGEGIKEGEVVMLAVPECAKPMLMSLRRAVVKAGGNPIVRYLPDNFSREFFELASQKQLEFFAKDYSKGIVDQIDHSVSIIADVDKFELEGIDPEKIMTRSKAYKPYSDWKREKENKGELTWTLALYGTEAMAKEANMGLEEYWEQIINACYLDKEDPVQEWRNIFEKLEEVKDKLNSLEIKKLHVKGEDVDLTIGIGKKRKWMAGSGRNIPSFEMFISPDWRMTEGRIRFNQPLYRYGNLIEGVELEFENGKIVKASAEKGEEVLKEMIAVEGADQVGEYSLTDSRLSRITKFMGETLYDENTGGKFGNTHIALGSSYKDSYPGDPSKVSDVEWKELGYNDSVVHTDIVSTSDRAVIAELTNGSMVKLYENGKFVI